MGGRDSGNDRTPAARPAIPAVAGMLWEGCQTRSGWAHVRSLTTIAGRRLAQRELRCALWLWRKPAGWTQVLAKPERKGTWELRTRRGRITPTTSAHVTKGEQV
jgi:hypothetical protein